MRSAHASDTASSTASASNRCASWYVESLRDAASGLLGLQHAEPQLTQCDG